MNLPKSLYRDAANRIKKLASDPTDSTSKEGKISLAEREMIYRLASRLLEIRMSKLQAKLDKGMDESGLTVEEKFALEPLTQFHRRLAGLKNAVLSGQASYFERVAESVAKRSVLVRFERSSPPLVGVDLAKYGPFQAGDLAVIPLENARPMIKQGSIKEVLLN